MKYIKSPLNYVGGKYKLLEQIIPMFPENIDTFVDLFGGGFNVGINVDAKTIIYNDINFYVEQLLEYFSQHSFTELDNDIKNIINKYNLTDTTKNGYEYYGCVSSDGCSKANKDAYMKLRQDWNNDKSNIIQFYVMILFAFSNQIRFNNNGNFNMPVGKRDYNTRVRKNLETFVSRLHSQDRIYQFNKQQFNELDIVNLSGNVLVYCDPPYFNSVATYNENNGWTETDEQELLNTLDNLNNKGIKFALSNNLKYNNQLLLQWMDKYNVRYLDHTYANCNYHKLDKTKDIEVLITNY